MLLRWLFERLETSPGQERVIRQAAEELQDVLREVRGKWKDSLGEVAEALRGDEFGHEKIAAAWVRQDGALEQARLALVENLQKVHEALEPHQRKVLAELLERGPTRAW